MDNLSQQTTDIPKSAPFLAIRKRLLKRLPKHIIDCAEQIADDTLRKMIIDKAGKEIYALADNIAADVHLTDDERKSLRRAFIDAMVQSVKTGEEPDLGTALRAEFGERRVSRSSARYGTSSVSRCSTTAYQMLSWWRGGSSGPTCWRWPWSYGSGP